MAIFDDSGLRFGNTAARPQYFDLTATQSAGAITTTVPPHTSVFRNTSLTSGLPLVANSPATLTGTIPSGATLGAVSGVSARIAILEFFNGGTPVQGWANFSGGVLLDGSNLLSPTTISAGATSATTVYSASAVSANSPYRVLGYFDAVNTGGTWGNPTLVHGDGSQVLAAMATLGYGQTWQNMTSSRALSTTYYNTTGKPITVMAYVASTTASGVGVNLNVNGVVAVSGSTTSTNYGPAIVGVVPPGQSYSVTIFAFTGSITTWTELR